VKNTFLDIEDDTATPPRRRTASLPPSLKLLEKVEEKLDMSPLENSSDVGSTEVGSGSLFQDDCSEEAVEPVPDVVVPRPPRTKLKSTSASFLGVQKKDTATTPAHPILQFIYSAIHSLASQLMASGYASKFDIVSQDDGYEVRLHLDNQLQVNNMERLQATAKKCLLSWAESTSNIYILGYCGTPFLPLNSSPGFIGTLSPLTKDERTTCWESFKWGSCGRGATCRWAHPDCLITVTLRICIDDSLYYQGFGYGAVSADAYYMQAM